MLVTVLGVRKVDFTDQRTNQTIKGHKIFYKYAQPDDEYLQGEITADVFVTEASGVVVPVFKFGEQYDFVQEVIGIGNSAKVKLKEILTKDGKKPVAANGFTSF